MTDKDMLKLGSEITKALNFLEEDEENTSDNLKYDNGAKGDYIAGYISEIVKIIK